MPEQNKKRVGPALVFAAAAFAVLALFAVATANNALSFVTGDVYKVTVVATPSTGGSPSTPSEAPVYPGKVGFAAGYKEGMKTAKLRGYKRGRLLGYKHGFDQGEHEGFKASQKIGYKAGRPAGLKAGRRAGAHKLASQLAAWNAQKSQTKKGASGG